MRVIKRDGTLDEFNPSRVESAITSAMSNCGVITMDDYCLAKRISEIVSNKVAKFNKVSVEYIQDLVEQSLMQSSRKDVAKAYVLYREERSKARGDNKILSTYGKKINASNVENQNANLDEKSFGGRKGQAADAIAKEYALKNCMCKKSKMRHLNNEIYIHDLDSYALGMHNCLSIPFDKLLKTGVKTRQVDIRPANSVNTAFQLVAVYMQLQSLQQFGGVSATHLDWTMVPYVRKSFVKHYKKGLKYICGVINLDKCNYTNLSITDPSFSQHRAAYNYAMNMTRDEVYQAVEGMYHNLNSLQSRSGNQLPFSSINYGTCTLPEGRMVIKALLDVSLKGLGPNHQTSIFPCGIFQYMKGVNDAPDTPNYDLFQLAIKSTAERVYPNYVNVDWSGNAGYDPTDPNTFLSSMGCRTINGFDVNGLGQLKDGRGNICPVTIIMPTIAMQTVLAHSDCTVSIEDEFINKLDTMIHDAKDMLIERFEYICSQPMESARFMYENGTMEGYIPEEGIRSALKHGTLAIGQIGLAETLQILMQCDHTTEKGMAFAKRIEQLFKDRCAEFKEQYKLNFGVYYTPAENLCYTAMSKFKEKCGEIKNVSDKTFFTNSMHVPVWHQCTPHEKIDIESQLTGYSSAGCITYVELPAEAHKNLQAVEELVHYAMNKDIPYFAINVPNDVCKDCGTICNGLDVCPSCGSTRIKKLRRVTGYVTSDYEEAFNPGKQDEVGKRFKHSEHEIC